MVHARCHRTWHRFGVHPPDPRLRCPICGKWKAPTFPKCRSCALADPGRRCACGGFKHPREDECSACFSARMTENEAAFHAAFERRPVNPANMCACGEFKTAKERLCQNCAYTEEVRANGLDPKAEDLPGDDESTT